MQGCLPMRRSFVGIAGVMVLLAGCQGPRPGAAGRPRWTGGVVTIESPQPVSADMEDPLLVESFDWPTLAEHDWDMSYAGSFAMVDRVGGGRALRVVGETGQDVFIKRTVRLGTRSGQILRVRLAVRIADPLPPGEFEGPRLKIEFERDADKVGPALLPFRAFGPWEYYEDMFAAPASPGKVTVTVGLDRCGGRMEIDDLRIEVFDPATRCRIGGATDWQSPNLIVGGDFEIGQKGFSTGVRLAGRDGSIRLITPPTALVPEAASGNVSLQCGTEQGQFGVNFNWVRLEPKKTYTLSFFARTTKPGRIRAAVVTPDWRSVRRDFDLTGAWQRYSMTFPYAMKPEGRAPFDVAYASICSAPDAPLPDGCVVSLDGVQLEAAASPGPFRPAEPVRVGIVTGRETFSDLACLWGPDEEIRFAVVAANDGDRARAIILQISAVDVFGRKAWGRSTSLSLRPGQIESVSSSLRLPRGPYTLRAYALHSGVSALRATRESFQLVGLAERNIAVVDLNPPEARQGAFGVVATGDSEMAVKRGCELGAGWVRVDVPCDAALDASRLAALGKCAEAKLRVVVRLGIPSPRPPRVVVDPRLVKQLNVLNVRWFELGPEWSLGLASEAALNIQRAAGRIKSVAQRNQVVWTSGTLGGPVDPTEQVSRVLEGQPALGLDALGIELALAGRPEEVWGIGQKLGVVRQIYGFESVWNTGSRTPGPPGYQHCWPFRGYLKNGANDRKPVSWRPALNVSLMTRQTLLALAAGMERTCWDTGLLVPGSVADPTLDLRLHAYDNTPKANLVVLNFLAGQFHNAEFLQGNVLQDQGVYHLTFQRGDRLLTAIWRPGIDAPLALDFGFEHPVQAYTVVGTPLDIPAGRQGYRLLVNQYVLFLEAAAEHKEAWLSALAGLGRSSE